MDSGALDRSRGSLTVSSDIRSTAEEEHLLQWGTGVLWLGRQRGRRSALRLLLPRRRGRSLGYGRWPKGRSPSTLP